MLDTRFTPLPSIPEAHNGVRLGDTARYEGSDTPNLPYYRRARKRGEDKKEKDRPKDPFCLVDLVA